MDFNFTYRYALVRKISKALPEQAIRDFSDTNDSPVNFELAEKQWNDYVNALKLVKNLEVVILKADNEMPDCVFTEDTMVAVPSLENPGKTIILVTTPGAESRRCEIQEISSSLQKINDELQNSGSERTFEIYLMEDLDPLATLEGGDVQFTGNQECHK